MISWEELVCDLTELGKLENGSGAEIEFEYMGKEYGIVVYRECVEFSCEPWGDDTSKQYASLDELGQATDFGFRLAEVWKDVEYPVCKPDFEEEGLELILKAYREALEKRHKRRREDQNERMDNV